MFVEYPCKTSLRCLLWWVTLVQVKFTLPLAVLYFLFGFVLLCFFPTVCLFVCFLNKNDLVYVVILQWQGQGWEGRGPEVRPWLCNGCCPVGGVPAVPGGSSPATPAGKASGASVSPCPCHRAKGQGTFAPQGSGVPAGHAKAPPCFLHPPTSPPPELFQTL